MPFPQISAPFPCCARPSISRVHSSFTCAHPPLIRARPHVPHMIPTFISQRPLSIICTLLSSVSTLPSSMHASLYSCVPYPRSFTPCPYLYLPFMRALPYLATCDFPPSILELIPLLFMPPNLLFTPLVAVQRMGYIRGRRPSFLLHVWLCILGLYCVFHA
jgi:hypothetical protein